MDGSRGVVRTIQSFWTPVSTGEFTRTDWRTSITTVGHKYRHNHKQVVIRRRTCHGCSDWGQRTSFAAYEIAGASYSGLPLQRGFDHPMDAGDHRPERRDWNIRAAE